MRNLKADYLDRIELFEFEDAGFTVLLSHTEQVVNLVHDLLSEGDTGITGTV